LYFEHLSLFRASDFDIRIYWFSTMAKIEIDQERCKGCGLCTIACPKALMKIGEEINRQGYFYVVWDANGQCTGCAICGEICPDVAIRVWKD
jgi:2-oxoglutarate ferredoxin oxidoreductase subunit delta